jgi:multimeric flavodoxin WrbA
MAAIQVNILGISGTVIKGGNCDTLVKEALKGAEELGNALEVLRPSSSPWLTKQ